MVRTRDLHDVSSEAHFDVDQWVSQISSRLDLPDIKRNLLASACDLSFKVEQQARASTEIPDLRSSAVFTGLEMAEILADLRMDEEGLIAAILYRHVREGYLPLADVEKRFGAVVASLINSVLQMAIISRMRNDSTTDVFGHQPDEQAAKVRQMLVSIIDDVRVALIKLAERTCAIRNVKASAEAKRIRVAREIVDVYAPLAHRLGIGHLKWELEDLAFRYLEPLEYKRIARLLSEKRRDRQTYIDNVIEALRQELVKIDVAGEVSGRAKHIFSIWKKMQTKGISFSKIYDIRAVRVLVPTISDCYTLLGIVHNKWRNIPDEFDDYIASPKENGYRSLHTAVIGPQHRILEIQIRTFDMHEEAEFGICAHWQYKGAEPSAASKSYESKIAWLRQVLEWHDEIGSEDAKSIFKLEGSSERIYVFTPEGHVVDLPPLSTPLDFAYRIHTEVGHRCRGCKINGRIAPLNTPLKTADQVEILTGKYESPSRDWLSSTMGYLHSAKARAKVKGWFRKQDLEKNLAAGKSMLDREFRQLGLRGIDLDVIGEKCNKKGAEGLYEAIGAGDVSMEYVVRLARLQLQGVDREKMILRRARHAIQYRNSTFYIYGVGNLLTRIARCCNPVPGEEISGYITSGRGVTIHRQDCGSLLRHRATEPERIIQVHWGGKPIDVYAVPVRLIAYDRSGLLRDITAVIDRMSLSIESLHSDETRDGKADIQVMVQINDFETLQALIARLRQIPNVVEVSRISE